MEAVPEANRVLVGMKSAVRRAAICGKLSPVSLPSIA